jgi:hypothetical protein
MSAITVAGTRDRFLRGGRPFFYLADTCWSAFTNVRPGEWEQYLDVRASQGFNALQITILPQWDRSLVDFAPPPFRTGRDGKPDYAKPEASYFENASRMLEAAASRGIVPALVLLWCDRVRGTWKCRDLPEAARLRWVAARASGRQRGHALRRAGRLTNHEQIFIFYLRK